MCCCVHVTFSTVAPPQDRESAARREVFPTAESKSHRVATLADVASLRSLVEAAISELQKPFLTAEQISASRAIMGLDTQLIADGTYFVIEVNGNMAGCGGWSRRATLYGSDHTHGRNSRLLDPAAEPARIRAMYTHPDYTRRGLGRLILQLCEDAARSEGFTSVELMSTMAGVPLYRACGYDGVESVTDNSVPLLRMTKRLTQ